jgi:perosamine synthetase
MDRTGPRILLIGGTYRALCVLERLLERGSRIAAFIGVEGGGERDFCPEILEICDRASIPARSGHKLGEEIVRWLEDRIRPEIAIAVGLRTEVPVAIGGNCRLGLVEIRDMLQHENCVGVSLHQRGKAVEETPLAPLRDDEQAADRYMTVVDAIVDALDQHMDRLTPQSEQGRATVSYARRELPELEPQTLEVDGPGAQTAALEGEVARFVGADRVLALRSSHDAFALLYAALGLHDAAEVIVGGIVSPAALGALESSGASPVFADVAADRLTLHPGRVEDRITPGTRGLLVSHTLGQPAELDVLYSTAHERGLELIEDAGDSLGARFGKSRLGRSPCTCVFQVPLRCAGKRVDAALVTAPSALADRIEPHAKELRLGNAAASLVRSELRTLEDRIATRRANASTYSSELVRYDAFRIPAAPADALSTYAGYLLRLTRYARTTADDLHKLLAESGFETRRLQLPVRERDLAGLPTTEAARASGLLLPVDECLDVADQERLLDAIFGYAIG